MTKKKIIIISIVLIAIVLLFVFRIGGGQKPEDELVPVSSNLGNDFVSALLGVENITLDTSLLDSQIFQSLSASGAYVDPNPARGKSDPFSASITSRNTNSFITDSLREINLGQGAGVVDPNIIVSRLTTTTATVAIIPAPENINISAIAIDPIGAIVNIPPLVYRANTREHSAVVTGLKPKTLYTIRIQSPDNYAGLQAQFETK